MHIGRADDCETEVVGLLIRTHSSGSTDRRDVLSRPLSNCYYKDGLLTPHFAKIAGRMHPKDYNNIETAEGRKNRARLNSCLAVWPKHFLLDIHKTRVLHSVDFDVQC